VLTLSLRPDNTFESVGWSVVHNFAARVWLKPLCATTRTRIARKSVRTTWVTSGTSLAVTARMLDCPTIAPTN